MKYYFRTLSEVFDSGDDFVKLRDWNELRELFSDSNDYDGLDFVDNDPGMDETIYTELKEYADIIDVRTLVQEPEIEWFKVQDEGAPDWIYHVYMLEPVDFGANFPDYDLGVLV